MIVALFLYQAARAAIVQSHLGDRIRALTVADIMDREPVTIPAETSLLDAQEEFFLRYRWPWFAVVGDGGRYVGVLRAERLETELREGRPALTAAEVSDDEAPWRIGVSDTLETLLTSEGLGRLGAVLAVEADGRLAGVVTLAEVRRALAPQSALIESAATAPPRRGLTAPMPAHDVLIIGAGLAGQRAALAAADAGVTVAIMSKVHPVRSHSVAAAGGINAAHRPPPTTGATHAYDTVKGSDFLGDQDAIEIMCAEAPSEVMHLEHIGRHLPPQRRRRARPAAVRRRRRRSGRRTSPTSPVRRSCTCSTSSC